MVETDGVTQLVHHSSDEETTPPQLQYLPSPSQIPHKSWTPSRTLFDVKVVHLRRPRYKFHTSEILILLHSGHDEGSVLFYVS